MMKNSVKWMLRVILRGIEGLIADDCLLILASTGDANLSVLSDYFEAKQMAEQVYAQCLGWGL